MLTGGMTANRSGAKRRSSKFVFRWADTQLTKNRELMFLTPQLDSVNCEMEDTAEYKTMCEQQVDGSDVNFFQRKK